MKAVFAFLAVCIAVAVAQPSVSGTIYNYGCGALNPTTLASTSTSCPSTGPVAIFAPGTNPSVTSSLSVTAGTATGIGSLTITVGSTVLTGSVNWATVSGIFLGQVTSVVNSGSSVANCSGAWSQLTGIYTQFNLVCADMTNGNLFGVALGVFGAGTVNAPTANFGNTSVAFMPQCNCTGSVTACPSAFTASWYKSTYAPSNNQFLQTLTQTGYGGTISILGRSVGIFGTNTGLIIEAAIIPVGSTSPVLYPAGYASLTPSNVAGTFTFGSSTSVITLYSYNLQNNAVCTLTLTQTAGVATVVANMLVIAFLAVAGVVLSVVM